jgi:cytochrome c-type biogenesis protein CcmH/NrfG
VISRTVTPPAISRSPTLDPQSTTETPAVARTVTGAPPNVPRVPTADKLDARDAFQRGEMAMRRDQVAQAVPEFARAVELQPEEPEYCAMYAWAKFCCAADKQAVAEETRKALARVLARESDSVTARMCLGRVERMLGRDKEALREFEKVLAVQPHHAAAQSEARVLEARLRR